MNIEVKNFLGVCENEGILQEWFCVSDTRESTVFKKVYICQVGGKLCPCHKYVIKYFPQDTLFICWNAQIKNRKNYRLQKKKAIESLEYNKLIAQKGIEFAWGEQEDVYVFNMQDINRFTNFIKNLEKENE